MLKDPQLKVERGYTHPHSFVRSDGSEVLFGNDWKKRKIELWERCDGRCEHRFPVKLADNKIVYHRCIENAADPHHLIARWPKRIDNLYNLLALCREHHKLLDGRKIGGRK